MSEEYLLADSEFHFPRLHVKDAEKCKRVLELTKQYRLTRPVLEHVKKVFLHEIEVGLAEPSITGTDLCSLSMINTFITEIPNGEEQGEFLSLDLGSTNFRVCLTRLEAGLEDMFLVKYYDIPDHLRWGKAVQLFDRIADCVHDFLTEKEISRKTVLPLGFTFSYPMKQQSIDSGLLVTWTKSYDIKDAIGKDAAKLLQDSFFRRGLLVKVEAILNDSSGTLVKGIYLHHECAISLIMGTGFNACYLEKASRVPHFARVGCGLDDVALINLECGAFGDNGCIDFFKTDLDFEMDRESLFPRSFSFEKLFSGFYLGDNVRRLMLKLVQQNLLFDGVLKEKLHCKKALRSTAVSIIEGDQDGSETRNVILDQLEYDNISDDDVAIIRFLCALLSVRAALLISALAATLVERVNRKSISIAIDGSMYKKHPKLGKLMSDFINELAPGYNVSHFLAEDGSGKGAGLVVAALHHRRANGYFDIPKKTHRDYY